MKVKSEPFNKIKREYLITSAEIKKALDIKGEIISIGLSAGRSPKDIEDGVSADKDEWYITTEATEKINPQTSPKGDHSPKARGV